VAAHMPARATALHAMLFMPEESAPGDGY
jgi:hypothetical protein